MSIEPVQTSGTRPRGRPPLHPRPVVPPTAPEAPPAEEIQAPAKPPEPEMEPQLGDRTPAWAEWCREHDPARFVQHFHDLRPYEE